MACSHKLPCDHKLPRMEHGYICYPDWLYRLQTRRDWLFRLCAWIGDTFNDGCYCFTVDCKKGV